MASTQVDTTCAGKFYKHQPLDVKKHQIRLLKLRNPPEHTMDHRLVTFDFESAPSYVALSYTWGEERPTGSVRIDGKRFEIRTNLLNFLRTYETHEYLWIDQICIDQSNPEERSHQCTPSTQQAALDFNNGVLSYPKHGRRDNGSSDDKKTFNRPTLALLHNSYFDQLWIVQELMLSKNVCILVEGNFWVSWESLSKKNEQLRDEIREMLPSTSWMVDAQYYRFIFAGHTPVSVTYYITLNVGKFCDKKCEDPRDKVYGLMALVQPSSQVEVDSAKSAHQVFLDTLMLMISEYWCMTPATPHNGYQVFRVTWTFEEAVKSSLSLARAIMGFTDLETFGLRSFVECIWERVLRDEDTAQSTGLKVDAETHCITSVDSEPETHQLSRNERLAETCDRWWYEFEGNRYYHDCREWSGKAKFYEYTASY
ncbi:hypothetical protein K504DRAFT_533336 [Pleomassaria siparia CBS 279.74]|uniref:Heterokaryon incompatibility domain-containing protein n=1 Tax=Pleomassaria siparia CBS 279.74 TaxID=1314801 RepID=A0A6G1KD32_9PLEO|nr:hypothetical protein K504DRAFT_533336 [Pleomassaria siparia CBS 279.74]